MSRRTLAVVTAVAIVAAVPLGGSVAARATAPHPTAPHPTARRVLVVSLPNVGWDDVQAADAPNLRRLLGASGVAVLSSAGPDSTPTIGDGYVTISTGARAETGGHDAACVAAGAAALGTITCPGARAIAARNDGLLYDAHVGLLGTELHRAGIARAVLAGEAGPRSAVALALADETGTVTGSLHGHAGAAAFRGAWRDRAVVLVEAPGLATARPAARSRALAAFDARLGELLSLVEPSRDAVLLAAPVEARRPLRVTVAALRAPGLEPGLMRSAFTRRAGVVAHVDIAPTILDLLGFERPREMEGRPFAFARRGGTLDERIAELVAINRRAQFRDDVITQAGGVLVAAQFLLIALGLLAFRRGRRPARRAAAALELGALSLLLFLPLSYLAMTVPFARESLPAYWAFTVLVAVAAAAAARALTDRRGVGTLIVTLAAVVGVIVADVLTGARLQFNGTFGYSPTIGGRFAGLGNLGYAQLAAGGVLLAGLLAYRVGGRAGVRWATALLALVVVVDGLPLFGADVGGVLSMVPAFGVTVAMWRGWRLRGRVAAAAFAGAAAVLGTFAAIDLARPAEDRSHLGRLLAGDGSDLATVLRRKIDANLDVLTAWPVAMLLPFAYLAVAYLVYRSPGPLGAARTRIPQLTAALAGLGTVAVLGTLLNDSGITITGMMLAVAAPALTVLALRSETVPTAAPRVPAAEPAEAPV